MWDAVCDLGYISPGILIRKTLLFWNAGTQPGEFQIECPSQSPLHFSCLSGSLQPLDSNGRAFLATSSKADGSQDCGPQNGIFSVELELIVHEKKKLWERIPVTGLTTLKTPYLSVCGDVVPHSVTIKNASAPDGEDLTTVNFWKFIYGEKRVVNALIINDGPNECQCTLTQHTKELSILAVLMDGRTTKVDEPVTPHRGKEKGNGALDG
jgi:hypothetical protein